MGWSIWGIVRAPEHWVYYAYLAWSLLLAAWPISQYVRSPRARPACSPSAVASQARSSTAGMRPWPLETG